MNRGVWYGAGAYALWGLLPVYWKLLQSVAADQIIAHRIVWSFLLLAAVLLPLRARAALRSSSAAFFVETRVLVVYAVAGAIVALNWFLYVWAVNHGLLVEASLGYFLTPLVNVLLAIAILSERLRRWQWVAVALGAGGVLYLTFSYGAVPWIAIALALTFGTYGLVKKKAPYGALAGLTVETAVLLLPATAYLILLELRGSGAFGHASVGLKLLLAASGVITTVPLLLFAAAVQRVPLAVIGILQYISPTLNFLLGVLVYHEPFDRHQLVGFMIVWCAVVVFAGEGIRQARARPSLVAVPTTTNSQPPPSGGAARHPAMPPEQHRRRSEG